MINFRTLVLTGFVLASSVVSSSVFADQVKAATAVPNDREKSMATASMNGALKRSRGSELFMRASKMGDTKSMTRILIGNGAPADIRVVQSGGAGGPAEFRFECCSKKSWGPVIISW